MKKIYKHVVKVTILSEHESLEAALGQDWDLSDVEYAITDGDCIGSVNHESTDEVLTKDVEKELVAIGNDGTFFEVDDE